MEGPGDSGRRPAQGIEGGYDGSTMSFTLTAVSDTLVEFWETYQALDEGHAPVNAVGPLVDGIRGRLIQTRTPGTQMELASLSVLAAQIFGA